jgi:hypothetical protein
MVGSDSRSREPVAGDSGPAGQEVSLRGRDGRGQNGAPGDKTRRPRAVAGNGEWSAPLTAAATALVAAQARISMEGPVHATSNYWVTTIVGGPTHARPTEEHRVTGLLLR